jgi:hypothetical protein
MRAMLTPFNLAFRRRTPLACVEQFAECEESLPLRGIVYHMSRSGSTLISRMLAALPCNHVLSEPAPLSQILRLGTQIAAVDEDRAVRMVRGMVRALLRSRSPKARAGYVKLASTDVLYASLLRRAFPGVPSVFSFRDPLEVLASQARQCAPEVFPGALPLEVLEIDPARAGTLSLEDWIARAIAAACRAALRLDDCAFLDYASLPDAVVTMLPGVFGVAYDAAEREFMLAAAADDAKTPERRFTPDSEQKRRTASFAVREAAELLMPLYGELRSRAASASFSSGVNATESRK